MYYCLGKSHYAALSLEIKNINFHHLILAKHCVCLVLFLFVVINFFGKKKDLLMYLKVRV